MDSQKAFAAQALTLPKKGPHPMLPVTTISRVVELLREIENFLRAWCPAMLVQSGILFLLLHFLDRLLRQRLPARARYALWLLMLVKLVLPPTLALPSSPVSWFWPRPAFSVISTRSGAESGSRPSGPARAISNPNEPVRPNEQDSARSFGLALVWLAGMLILAALLAKNALAVRRRLRASTPAPSDWEDLARVCARDLGLRQRVRVRVGGAGEVPMITGLWRPVVLLPAGPPPDSAPGRIRAILLHEMAHLLRGDLWVHWVQTLLQIAYWWHPMVWLANARIRRLREEAADECVVKVMSGDALGYAETLVWVAGFCRECGAGMFAPAGLFHSKSVLTRRVERLGNADWTAWRSPAWPGWLMAVILGLWLLPMSPVRSEPVPAPGVWTARTYPMDVHMLRFLNEFTRASLASNLPEGHGKYDLDRFWAAFGFRDHPRIASLDFPGKIMMLEASPRDQARLQELIEDRFAPRAQVEEQAIFLSCSPSDWERLGLKKWVWRQGKGGSSAVVSSAEAQTLLQSARGLGGIEMVTMPSVLTESGLLSSVESHSGGSTYVVATDIRADKEKLRLTSAVVVFLNSTPLPSGPAWTPTSYLKATSNPATAAPLVSSPSAGSAPAGARVEKKAGYLPRAEAGAEAVVPDGDAILLETPIRDEGGKKLLLVLFLTLVDPAGNRLHPPPGRQ